MDAKTMTVWIVGLGLLAMVLLSPAACTMNRQRMVAEAIRSGADPTAAKCAIEADSGHSPACVLVAMKPK
jgi:hypothetical protein